MSAGELVSCIMPTWNRRRFVPRAIDYFLRQDYPDKELIVVDDGDDPVSDLMPADERIRYVRLDARATVGEKRNVACEAARGALIAHCDDDDWYAHERLSIQVRALAATGRDLCGLDTLWYYDVNARQAFRYNGGGAHPRWLTMLCYRRSLWEELRFRAIDVGEDCHFVWSVPPDRTIVLPPGDLKVCVIHGANVSPKHTSGPPWSPAPIDHVRRALGADVSFYDGLGAGEPPAAAHAEVGLAGAAAPARALDRGGAPARDALLREAAGQPTRQAGGLNPPVGAGLRGIAQWVLAPPEWHLFMPGVPPDSAVTTIDPSAAGGPTYAWRPAEPTPALEPAAYPAFAGAAVERADPLPLWDGDVSRKRLAIVFGTYNRRALLERAVASIRRAVGDLRYRIIAVDGGSTDGSRAWLSAQPDVWLIRQRGRLTGAVRAFNRGFARAVDEGFDHVCHFNDDAECLTERMLESAVRQLEGNPHVGAVAFELDLRGPFDVERVFGKAYSNFGVVRREAGMAAARAQGDPSGRRWWNPIYRTYGADVELCCWLWKLGFTVHAARGLRVHDANARDELRRLNQADIGPRAGHPDSMLFCTRWPSAASLDPQPAPRRAHGARVVSAPAPRPGATPPSRRPAKGSGDAIIALTSLSPAAAAAPRQRAAIRSWRDTGMAVRSFNHPSEIEPLARRFDVELIPVEGGSARSFTPIKAMLDWATERDAHVMIINADIELRMAPWELNRARWLSDGGLCYFVRYNHDGDLRRVVREPHGIDAFLFHGRHGRLFPDTSLCMGQPAWDYLVPHTFASHGLPISTVEFPAAFHREHPVRWSATDWHRGAIELDRVTGLLGDDRSYGACIAMTTRMRQEFDRGKVALLERPIEIRRWVERTFNYPGAKTFLELGAHRGTDTVWMAELPGVVVHAFEPDPRNRMPPVPNVIMNRAAISDREGRIPFLLSGHNRGQEWTYSSSIKRPKRHLDRYPVTFEETVEVDTVTLDGYCRRRGLEVIDFIWADIQGAEGEMVRGGQETLARTRYLFTEYSDDELYEGQATLADLLRMLPDFRVLELYDEDVLLENTALVREGSLA